MVKTSSALIVLADGEHVRFVRPGQDNAPHTAVTVDSPAAHRQSSDLGSDRPGATMHTGSTAHHALAPRHDLHKLAKAAFADSIARQLTVASNAGAFDALVLVAPAPILAEIRAGLDAPTAAKVIGVLAKDLVKTPDDALGEHLGAWLRPVRRPVM